ncbi:hypothetical protein MMC09_004638 [Bachmanniomyces sp. S44760]|nr:hypothetical protein [Bachmanniomyces sp. S44760]
MSQPEWYAEFLKRRKSAYGESLEEKEDLERVERKLRASLLSERAREAEEPNQGSQDASEEMQVDSTMGTEAPDYMDLDPITENSDFVFSDVDDSDFAAFSDVDEGPMANFEDDNRIASAKGSRLRNNARSQQPASNQQQPQQSPFNNVDPNVANGTQQNGLTFGQSNGASQNGPFQPFGSGANPNTPPSSAFNFSFAGSTPSNPFTYADNQKSIYGPPGWEPSLEREVDKDGNVVYPTRQAYSNPFGAKPVALEPEGNALPQFAPQSPFNFGTFTTQQSQPRTNMFGQPDQPNPQAPSNFGNLTDQQQPAQSNVFGQTPVSTGQNTAPSNDAMSTSPDNSQQKKQQTTSNPFTALMDASNKTQSNLNSQAGNSILHNGTSQPSTTPASSEGVSDTFSKFNKQPNSTATSGGGLFNKMTNANGQPGGVTSSGSIFDRVSQPNIQSSASSTQSGGLFGRISQPNIQTGASTSSSPAGALFGAVSTSQNTSNSEQQPQKSLFPPQAPSPTFSAPSGLFQIPGTNKQSSESTNKSNPVASLASSSSTMKPPVSSTPTFGTSTKQPEKPGEMPASNTKSAKKLSNPDTLSSSTQKSSSSDLISTESALFDHSWMFIVPASMPNDLNEEQFQAFLTAYRLRSLEVGFRNFILNAPLNSDIRPAANFFEEMKKLILAPPQLVTLKSPLKRKFASDAPDGNASKKTNATGPVMEGEGSKRPLFANSHSSAKRKADDQESDDTVDGNINGGKKSRGNDQISYPELSSTQSNSQTSNLFASIVNGSSDKTTVEKPESPAGAVPETLAAAPTTEAVIPSVESSPAFKVPSFGSGSGTNFMSQFGKAAEQSAQKDKEKRKADEFDSDEDDEAEWERKYEEEQRAKKAKTQEIANAKAVKMVNGQFVLSDSESSGAEKPKETVQPATPSISQQSKVSQQPAASTPSIFQQSNVNQQPAASTPSLFQPVNAGQQPSQSSNLFGSRNTPAATSFGGSVLSSAMLGAPPTVDAGNIFGHLSRTPSHSGAEESKNGDGDDEDSGSEPDSNKLKKATAEADTQKPASAPSFSSTNTFGSSVSFGAKPSATSTTPQKPPPSNPFASRLEFDEHGNPKRQVPPTRETNNANLFGTFASGNPFGPQANVNVQMGNTEGSSSPTPTPVNLGESILKTRKRSLDQQSTPQAKPNFFGASTSPIGDNTWKPESPIKFGTSTSGGPSFSVTAPSPSKTPSSTPFTGLFGAKPSTKDTPKPATNLFGAFQPRASDTSSTQPTNLFGASPKPAAPFGSDVGFAFGGPPRPTTNSLFAPSAASSRATSPGATTGESANESANAGDDDAAPPEEQIDLTAGGPGEEDEHVLFNIRSKAFESVDKKWKVRGVGILRVLKHRETGTTRMIMRSDPSGKIVLNAALMSGVSYHSPTQQQVSMGIANDAGKISPWLVRVGKDEDAKKLASLLEEHKFN